MIQVTQVLPDGSAVVLANATMYSYPLRFDGGALECPPAVLDQLSTRGVGAGTPSACMTARERIIPPIPSYHPLHSPPTRPTRPRRCRFDATPKCCDFMRTGASPYQTITVPMLGVLAIIVPVLYVSLSICRRRCCCRVIRVHPHRVNSPSHDRSAHPLTTTTASSSSATPSCGAPRPSPACATWPWGSCSP